MCDCITERATVALALASGAHATKSTAALSGRQAKRCPDSIALCTGDVHHFAVRRYVCTRCGKLHACGCRLWLLLVAAAGCDAYGWSDGRTNGAKVDRLKRTT